MDYNLSMGATILKPDTGRVHLKSDVQALITNNIKYYWNR